MKPEKPIQVEVLAYAPVAFFHCRHCEVVWQPTGVGEHLRQEQLDSSLPEDLKKEYRELSDWVRQMKADYGERIAFSVIDAASIEGWLKSVRYRLHKYPAVIVDGKQKITGCDCFGQATTVIRQKMEVASAV
jgi:hypothetical protein